MIYPVHEIHNMHLRQQNEHVGIDAGIFVFKEFWPDINHALFHGAKPNQP
jgi:hypothetical protein